MSLPSRSRRARAAASSSARRRADDLDADRLRHLVLHALEGRVPADRRGAGQAPAAIEDSIDAAERTARGRRAARASTASGSPRRAARPTRSSPAPAGPARPHENEILAEARAKREEMMEQTRRDIEAETRRAIQQIRAEVADLTVLATEKVTRKSLDRADQKRLVEEALAELDFAAAGQRGAPLAMEEIASVYARSLFEVAQEQDKLDDVRDAARRSSPTRSTGRASCRCSSSRRTSRRPRRRTGSTGRSPAPTRSSSTSSSC